MIFTAFRRFLLAAGLANFGDGIAIVSWGWIATVLTRDPLLIALVPVALKAPWFVFSLPAGIVVDRHDRRKIIIAADALRAFAYAAAGLMVWWAPPFGEPAALGTDHPTLFILVALAASTVGVAEVLRDNAAQTILPALVDEANLERSNGRLWAVEMVMNSFAGTAAAGVLLSVSLALPLGINAACMALAAALVLGLRGNFMAETEPVSPEKHRHWRSELGESVRYLMGEPILRNFAVLTGLFNFAFEGLMVTLVLIVRERLGLGPLALSAIFAVGAAFGVLAGFVNHRIVRRVGRSAVLRWAMLVSLVFPAAVMVSPPGLSGLVLLCLAFGISEFGGLMWNTVSVSYRQRHIPRRMLGRVNAAYRLFRSEWRRLACWHPAFLCAGPSRSSAGAPRF